MKRLIPLISCVVLMFASVVAAVAACKQISFNVTDNHHAPLLEVNHSDSPHEHSDDASIHCPTLEPFLPTALILPRPNRGPQHSVSLMAAYVVFSNSDNDFHRLIHDPPATTRAGSIPPYLFISVLRI